MSVLDVHCLRFILYLYAELVQLIKDKLSFVNILEEKPNLVVNKKVNANGIHWEKKHSLQNKFKQIHCGGKKDSTKAKGSMEIKYCDAIKGSNIGSLQKIFWKMLCKYYANIVQIFWKYCGAREGG